MSASTILTLSTVPSVNNLQKTTQFYQSSNSSNNNINGNNNNTAYNHLPREPAEERTILLKQNTIYSIGSSRSFAGFPIKDSLLQDTLTQSAISTTTTTAKIPKILQKSNSYNGTIKTKSTILKQDSVNGRIATSLTDSDAEYGGIASSGKSYCNPSAVGEAATIVPGDGDEEQDAFLVSSTSGGGASSTSGSRRGTRSHGKSRSSFCFRAHAFISRNWYLSYLVPLSILLALMFVAYLTRDYAKRLLYWIETQNSWVIFALFMLLFIVVSFPVVVGYFVLMITSGYLFGFIKGFPTVILGANMGIAIAHVTIRSLRHRIPMHKLIKNETGRAILRVISGPRAFRVVLFTRLTPIPFGIQNAIFGVSSINPRVYHSATFLGLLPAQTINVYLGSTLRSMHEVLSNHGTALTGYISFGVEVICGVALMFWVVQKARKELSATLLSDATNEGKLIDIQV